MGWLILLAAAVAALGAFMLTRRRPPRAPTAAPAAPPADRRLGQSMATDGQRQVQVESLLGQGGMATVYRGRMEGAPVAVKSCGPSPQWEMTPVVASNGNWTSAGPCSTLPW
ncbi:MAG TPA: hypothetical protein VGO93_19340 [Candidatus Xenobia bacterium]